MWPGQCLFRYSTSTAEHFPLDWQNLLIFLGIIFHYITYNCDCFCFCGSNSSIIHWWLAVGSAFFVKNNLSYLQLYSNMCPLYVCMYLCTYRAHVCIVVYTISFWLKHFGINVVCFPSENQKLHLSLKVSTNPDSTAARQKNRRKRVQNKRNNACKLSLSVTF